MRRLSHCPARSMASKSHISLPCSVRLSRWIPRSARSRANDGPNARRIAAMQAARSTALMLNAEQKVRRNEHAAGEELRARSRGSRRYNRCRLGIAHDPPVSYRLYEQEGTKAI